MGMAKYYTMKRNALKEMAKNEYVSYTIYCVSKQSCPFLHSKSLCKNGQTLLEAFS